MTCAMRMNKLQMSYTGKGRGGGEWESRRQCSKESVEACDNSAIVCVERVRF